ncbi:MAG: hydroxymethylglutaryl-CoA lyase, partial [Bacteroidota bacterium]
MPTTSPIHVIDCPRDAMQGIKPFIPTETKIRYLQSLLACGFHTLDFGSFVSPKAIPQMRDTAEVLAGLDLSQTQTQLLSIVANRRG